MATVGAGCAEQARRGAGGRDGGGAEPVRDRIGGGPSALGPRAVRTGAAGECPYLKATTL